MKNKWAEGYPSATFRLNKMIIDNTIEIDSPIFADAEYQDYELLVFLRNDTRHLIIHDVSERDFLRLQKDPSHEALKQLLEIRFWEYNDSF